MKTFARRHFNDFLPRPFLFFFFFFLFFPSPNLGADGEIYSSYHRLDSKRLTFFKQMERHEEKVDLGT